MTNQSDKVKLVVIGFCVVSGSGISHQYVMASSCVTMSSTNQSHSSFANYGVYFQKLYSIEMRILNL